MSKIQSATVFYDQDVISLWSLGQQDEWQGTVRIHSPMEGRKWGRTISFLVMKIPDSIGVKPVVLHGWSQCAWFMLDWLESLVLGHCALRQIEDLNPGGLLLSRSVCHIPPFGSWLSHTPTYLHLFPLGFCLRQSFYMSLWNTWPWLVNNSFLRSNSLV